ncbi:MAG: RNA-dependent DNA polymerase [Symploca sp. SIO3E6]|nr:RNA-dependent DNA polymerase [Caldora sp. SIO3E6]
MIRHVNLYSESWKQLPWKKFRRNLFRLQHRIWKAIRAGDKARAKSLMKLVLRSRAARLLAIRQVTQLNQGKKTAGVDGKKSLSFKERFDLELELGQNAHNWRPNKLREIPIPKKDGSMRILKVPTIRDRAWQCLVKYAMEPAHEATFHARSYGFRPGRSAHDAQKFLFHNLNSKANGKEKTILELDIEKCFDRINQRDLMERVIAPGKVKTGLWRILQKGINPEFPEQGTPQGGVISPLLANISLNGIEDIHQSVRYADDMVYVLKPGQNPDQILKKVEGFLTVRGLNVKATKTKVTASTDGFDFLGWNFRVQSNGKFRSTPSEENLKTFNDKVKHIINNSNYGSKVKAEKLAPIIRGWRNYHRYCKMDGSRLSLWHTVNRAWKVFNKEAKQNRFTVTQLVKKAFPSVSYSENKHVNVKGEKSPFDGDITYWSQRNSKLYDGATAKTLKKQKHTCGHCGLPFLGGERVHLHHVDGNHSNWKPKNLLAVHESCHDYIHMSRA